MDFFLFFSGFSGGAGYLIVLGTLILCGLGVPVPEDVILISGGYIAAEAGHNAWPMVLTGLVGIMIGDSMIYSMGRRFGLQLAGHRFLKRYVTEDRLTRVMGMFAKHGHKILIAARFMPGVRSVAFFSAGAMRVPYWKFFLFDGLAALVSAPLWVILGFRFGHDVLGWAKQFQSFLLAAAAIGAGIFVLYRYSAGRREAREAAALGDAPALPSIVAASSSNVPVNAPAVRTTIRRAK